MDPTTTLSRFLQALQDEDRDEVLESLEDLTEWIEKGGFLPSPLEDKYPTFICKR